MAKQLQLGEHKWKDLKVTKFAPVDKFFKLRIWQPQVLIAKFFHTGTNCSQLTGAVLKQLPGVRIKKDAFEIAEILKSELCQRIFSKKYKGSFL